MAGQINTGAIGTQRFVDPKTVVLPRIGRDILPALIRNVGGEHFGLTSIEIVRGKIVDLDAERCETSSVSCTSSAK